MIYTLLFFITALCLPLGADANETFDFSKKAPKQLATLEAMGQEIDVPTEEPEEEKEPSIFLNFDNASLSMVLNYLTDRKNVDVIPHKDLEAVKVSLMCREPMTLSQAWETLLILMETNGFTVIEVDGKFRVVPLAAGGQNALPCYSSSKGVEPEDLENSSKIIRYIYFCKNIRTSVAQSILAPLLSERGLQINNALQACIMTDSSATIKSALRIIKELDSGGLRQSVQILRLNHTNAEQVTKLFNEQVLGQQQPQQEQKIRIIADENKKEVTFFSKDTKIIPEPTHNQIILMGTADATNRIIEFIQKYIDIPLEQAQSRIHVKELKYAAAEQLKATLEAIIQPPRGQGSQSSVVEGDYKFFEDVVITAESPHSGNAGDQGRGYGNRLIIACNPADWQRLEAFIDQIDKPQAQVAVEMMIVDVKNDNEKALGADFRMKPEWLGSQDAHANSFMLPSTGNSMSEENLISMVGAPRSHSTLLSFGNSSTNDVWAIIRAAYKIDHSNIISQPYLVVNNNTTAEESIEITRKVAGKLESSNSTVAGGLYRTQDNVSAQVRAEVRPRINTSGIIELKIHIIVSEFKVNSDNPAERTTREIDTQASMAAGEVLVLGGLTGSKHDTSQWHVPILSSLPFIGALFRDTSRTNTKTNLYIFIRPTIIKAHFDLGPDSYTQLKLDYAKYQILGHDACINTKDPVQRYFFAPSTYGIKNKLRDYAENRMPIIDGFAEQQRTPAEVAIDRDPYFSHMKGEESSDFAYEPEEFGFASMPHYSPESFVSPGSFEGF